MLQRHAKLLLYLVILFNLLLIELNLAYWFKRSISLTGGLLSADLLLEGGFWVTGLITALCWIVVTHFNDFYASKRGRSIPEEWWEIVKLLFYTIVAFEVISFLFLQQELTHAAAVGFYITSCVTLIIEKTVIRSLLRIIRARGYNRRAVLVIGAGPLGKRLTKKLQNDPWMGYQVLGYLDDNIDRGTNVMGHPVLGDIASLPDTLKKYPIHKVFVALPLRAWKKLEEIMTVTTRTMIDVSLIPDIYQFRILNSSIHELDGMPIVNLVATPQEGVDGLIKRTCDILISTMVVVLTSPLMALIAIGVKLSSPGPIFFRQERMGLDGETFAILKFRSMRIDAEEKTGAIWAQENDPRRTKFGTFLRKTSLDELPQFFNVIWGDMSVVGPRPERPVFVNEFRHQIPQYMQRMKIKAGITGLAQVRGYRGNTSLEKRIECDIEYLENWSLWLDLKIIFQTLWTGLINKHAY